MKHNREVADAAKKLADFCKADKPVDGHAPIAPVVVQELAGACRTDEMILIGDSNDGSEGEMRRYQVLTSDTQVAGRRQAIGNNHEKDEERIEGEKRTRLRPLNKSMRRIKELSDWRGETLARIRILIKQADPEMVEEVKWRKPSNPAGVLVWSHAGMICTGETYKNIVKMTFAKGASLPDPSSLFNSSLEGNTRRAIDFHEGDKIDEKALQGAHSRRRGTEHVGASCRSSGPLSEETKERLRGVVKPAKWVRRLNRVETRNSGRRTRTFIDRFKADSPTD